MNYLCLAHRVQVLRSAQVAEYYWSLAMGQGEQALLEQNWLCAKNSFGCAFEIAKIRSHDIDRGQLSCFDERQLTLSAQYFAQVLFQQNATCQADSVLQFVRHHLQRKLASAKLTEDKSQVLAQLLAVMDSVRQNFSDANAYKDIADKVISGNAKIYSVH